MFDPALAPRHRPGLLALAAFGFLVPNGIFVYAAVTRPGAVREAFANPVSLCFMGEAFLLMTLLTWLVSRTAGGKGRWLGFLAMSLVGSLAFSVPMYLAMGSRKASD